jgi:plastocyanin
MKKLTLLLAAAGALFASAPATAATTQVLIKSTGFTPDEVIVRPGDTVTWRNTDTANHEVVSDTGVFKSQVLKPGDTFSFVFSTGSSYSYHDAMKTNLSGIVHVRSTKVTIGVTRIRAVFGSTVRVFGAIPTGGANEAVTIHITPYKSQSITKTVRTDSDGTYEFSYKPRIRTELKAEWNGEMSDKAPFVAVRPLVVFRPINARLNRFFVKVRAAVSYAGVVVRIQRQSSNGTWTTTSKVRLNKRGEARFTGRFPRGKTKARAWVARHPGYTVFSTVKTIFR